MIEGLAFVPAAATDLPDLEEIRAASFAPVFASFRNILGEEIYETAQRPEDEAQAGLLVELFDEGSLWVVYLAQLAGRTVGFVSIRLDVDAGVGEIGLNAVAPSAAGKGIGTAIYDFAVDRMRREGIRVATVATGGDPSHAPARRAYRKAGFDVEIPSLWMCRVID